MIKVYNLAKDYYQVTINGSTIVGDLNFMTEIFDSYGYSFFRDGEIVPIAGIEGVEYFNKLASDQAHKCEMVEQGFRHSYIACKICGKQ